MAVVKTKLGRIPCLCCGQPTVLKLNEAGTLTMSCDECDLSCFAKKGAGAAARMRAKLPTPAPDPALNQPGQAAEAKAPGTVPKEKTQTGTQTPAPTQTPDPAPALNPHDPFGFLRKKAA